ncbi:MAG: phosphoribosylformylglycinamidine synthase subunit PurL [Anaerolineae bacterium]
MMQTYRIEIHWQGVHPDGRATALVQQAREWGLAGLRKATMVDLYFLRGVLSPGELEHLCCELLADPICQRPVWRVLNDGSEEPAAREHPGSPWAVEVTLHPGVADPVAEQLLKGAKRIGVRGLRAAATGTRYELLGDLAREDVVCLAESLLHNPVIQTYTVGELTPMLEVPAQAADQVEVIPFRGLSAGELETLSTQRILSLSLDEMKAIQAHFVAAGRDPTDLELETLAQTWSEHCSHKTFKARIHHTWQGGVRRHLPDGGLGPDSGSEEINSLLYTYLREATEEAAKPWVRSAFADNAGVVAFDEGWDISFKVETHNHPSALEPFGGANTGVGGVVRDIMGVSARPIANTDVLCFGPRDCPREALPGGVLHPRRVEGGVVAGIEDYGNKMGIPTVNGAILYDEGYVGNPLVFCGCVGLAPRGSHRRQAEAGDLCVALGGRTGRDGLHGATFSSAELTHETGQTVGSVVQIGDPIVEKAVLEAVLQARDEGLYHAITDCGAGGFSSAAGEMGRQVGVEVELSQVPLKYPGLRPWEIWLSEAQERMVLAVPPAHLERLREICQGLDVELTILGHFTGDRHLTVRHRGQVVGSLPMDFLHGGIPQRHMQAHWEPKVYPEPSLPDEEDLGPTLLGLLRRPEIASKEPVIRRYDHEVQAGTVVKPLVGANADGPSDGAVLKPLDTEGWQGVALGCGINPWIGLLDPYAMAWAAVDEAMRNVVACGADPDRVALLDNFCWGDPTLPDRLGGLVRAAQGCYDAARAFGVPYISGKDSLHNEFVDPQGRKTPIPPTLLISALGIVPDVRQAVTSDLKAPGNLLYVLGETRPELGGSAWFRTLGSLGNRVPVPCRESPQLLRVLHTAMRRGWVRACHDCSEGGLGVALAEMALGGNLGIWVDLATLPRSQDVARADVALFSESLGRLVVEVAQEYQAEFEALFAALPWGRVGRVTAEPLFRVCGFDGREVVRLEVAAIRRAWKGEDG